MIRLLINIIWCKIIWGDCTWSTFIAEKNSGVKVVVRVCECCFKKDWGHL